jgi:hypothetical protein
MSTGDKISLGVVVVIFLLLLPSAVKEAVEDIKLSRYLRRQRRARRQDR